MDQDNRTISNILHGDKGFTLIDALIAIVIFSIGFLAISAMMISSANTARNTAYADWSVMAGQEAVEMLTLMDMGEDILSDGDHQPANDDTNPESAKTTIEWEILDSTDIDGDGTVDFTTIAMTVSADDELRLQAFFRRQSY